MLRAFQFCVMITVCWCKRFTSKTATTRLVLIVTAICPEKPSQPLSGFAHPLREGCNLLLHGERRAEPAACPALCLKGFLLTLRPGGLDIIQHTLPGLLRLTRFSAFERCSSPLRGLTSGVAEIPTSSCASQRSCHVQMKTFAQGLCHIPSGFMSMQRCWND